MEIVDVENVLYEINKSKFWGFAYSVSSVSEVEEKLNCIRTAHSKATHVCFAYVLSSPNVERCSDDGEPDGTAGKPILEILKKCDLTNTLIVVVRYFGGIKLGAGGLVRAYSTSAKNTVEATSMVEYIDATKFALSLPIQNRDAFLRMVGECGLDVLSKTYLDKLVVEVLVENKNILTFEKIVEKNNFDILKREKFRKKKDG